MKIFAKSSKNPEYYNRLPLPTQVKKLGEFLQKNIDSADKTPRKQPPNEYIIYMTIYYMIESETRKRMAKYADKLKNIEQKMYEMPIYLNITTYGQYIRVNVIQLDKYEITLGYLRIEPEELLSLPNCKQKILNYVKKRIEKKYEEDGYEVLI